VCAGALVPKANVSRQLTPKISLGVTSHISEHQVLVRLWPGPLDSLNQWFLTFLSYRLKKLGGTPKRKKSDKNDQSSSVSSSNNLQK